MLNLEILWEDNDIMVVNKPPFVVVNRAESVKEETVADWSDKTLKIEKPKTRNYDEIQFWKRSGIAHRLDKETSGCLIIAKNPRALTELLRQFKRREIKKEYLALIHGYMTPKEGVVKLPLSRSRFDREKWEIRYSGKMAETAWRVEKYFTKLEGFSLIRLFPKTGRTHQIRVHVAHLGYPIFSDEKYLQKYRVTNDRERLPFHFLHAQKIGFKDMLGNWRNVEAPLPSEETKLLLWMEDE